MLSIFFSAAGGYASLQQTTACISKGYRNTCYRKKLSVIATFIAKRLETTALLCFLKQPVSKNTIGFHKAEAVILRSFTLEITKSSC